MKHLGKPYIELAGTDREAFLVVEVDGCSYGRSVKAFVGIPQEQAKVKALREAVEMVLVASEDGGDFNDVDFKMLREALAKSKL
jgi:hypothetical protein